jgi:hypothetical protein
MRQRSGFRLLASLLLSLLLLAGPGLNQAGEDTAPSGGYQPRALPATGPRQQARAFPRLSLGGGRELLYVGMFSREARYRAVSKLDRFLYAMGAEPSLGQHAQQSEVPPKMLRSEQRLVEDFVPPAYAVAAPQVHSLLGNALDGIVTLAYGRASVLRAPQRVTTDSRQRVIVADPGIPAVLVLDPKGKTSFSILGEQGRRLEQPGGVAVDGEDNIYIADSKRGMVLVYDQYGRFVRYIGNFHGENMYNDLQGLPLTARRVVCISSTPLAILFSYSTWKVTS